MEFISYKFCANDGFLHQLTPFSVNLSKLVKDLL